MIKTGLCCLAGCLAAKFVFDELKQFQFEKIVFVDPASGQRHVNIKANCGDSVTYVVALLPKKSPMNVCVDMLWTGNPLQSLRSLPT
jgi:hypothetical protein